MSYEYIFTDSLSHHGIKGQRWGIRRFQNEDGSLTVAGKKRLSKKYKKLAIKAATSVAENDQRLRINAYNKSADIMNNGGIKKFNDEQERKYGKDFANRKGYETDYAKLFDKTFEKIYSKDLYDAYKSNKNFRKAQELVEKYSMTEWDDLAKTNEKTISELKKAYNLK